MFPQDLTEQKKKLMGMLGTAVGSLHKLDTILPAVQDLGKRHKGYGVTAAHYAPVGAATVPEEVERPAKVRVRYLDRDGARQEMECEGLLATCVQHEIDHLDGILFIDHISALKRNMILRKLLKARKEKEREEAEGKPAAELEAPDRVHTL